MRYLRRKKDEERRMKDEGRRKEEGGRRKEEEGRREAIIVRVCMYRGEERGV